MKRRAMLGQWKTPPQVLYPSSSGMKKSTSMPTFNSVPPSSSPPASSFSPPLHASSSSYCAELDMQESPFGSEEESEGVLEHFGSETYSYAYPPNPQLPVHSVYQTMQGGIPPSEPGPKRAYSYQDLYQNGYSDDEPRTGAHARMGLLVGKRSASHLAVDRGETWRPRHALLMGEEAMDTSAAKAASSSKESDQEEKRLKRLARNRASAKMRRIRKKNIVDTLEVEVEDLQQSIAYLEVLQETRAQNKPPSFFEYPRGELARAFEASQQPIQAIDEQELQVKVEGYKAAQQAQTKPDFRPTPKVLSDEERESLTMQIREQLAKMDQNGHREVLLRHLAASAAQDQSIHVIRRQFAVQMFVDQQISWAELLRITSMENNALVALLSGGHQISEDTVQALATRQRLMRDIRLKSKSIGIQGMESQGMYNSRSDPPDARSLGIDPYPCSNMYSATTPTPAARQLNSKVEALRQDLLRTLNLTDQQKNSILQLAYGMRKEQLCCQAVARVAATLSQKKWLDYPAIEQITDGFRGVLLQPQMDKFYNWSKRNLAAIEALEITPTSQAQER